MTKSWIELLDTTIQACAKYERPDLGQRLRERKAQLLSPTLRVLVLGEQGQGKSQLVNALVNASVCAVGDGLTTTAPAVLEYADAPRAAIMPTGQQDGIEGPATGPTAGAVGHPAGAEVAIETATARANAATESPSPAVHTRLGLPSPLLRSGLVLVDTPGIGGTHSARTTAALSELLTADAVLVTSDATAELSGRELELIANIAEICPAVLLTLTKIDLAPGWRAVLEANRARLTDAGLTTAQIPVSSTVRLNATDSADERPDSESGFTELRQRMANDWLGQAEELGKRSVARLSSMAVDQVLGPLRERLAAAQQGGTGEWKARWSAANSALEDQQRTANRVQTVLSDEFTDLVADVEHDLRERTRTILARAEEYFDEADPVRDWPQFERWLEHNLATAAETNFGWLLARFDWLARTVARQSDCAEQKMRGCLLTDVTPSPPAEQVRMPTVERFGPGQKMFVGLRGSYGGLLMVGLATTLWDMELINPISISAGALFGVKSVFEERGSRLKRRQAAAKSAAQRHIDDFFLTYNKESKEVARQMQRTLRDRLTEFHQQRRTELAATANNLKEKVDAESARRTQQTRELKAGVESLTTLRSRIQELSTARPALAARGGLAS